MDKASHFLFEYLFYTRERRRSEVLKSERPSGEPTCPLNHHAAHRWRGSRNGGDRSWEVKTLHTRHGNRRRCLVCSRANPPAIEVSCPLLLLGWGGCPFIHSPRRSPQRGSGFGSHSVTIPFPIIPIMPKVPAIRYVIKLPHRA